MKPFAIVAWRAALLVVAALVMSSPGPTAAVPPVYAVDLTTDPLYSTGGTGRVRGDLEFMGKTTFSYDLDVADLCPADGLGTSFYFISEMGDGDHVLSSVRGYDVDGCGNGWKHWSSTLQAQRKIDRTRVAQCWTDEGDLCALVSTKLGSWKENPTW